MQKNSKKVVILGTGGTIAGRAASSSDNIGYTAAQVGVQELLAAVPGLQGQSLIAEQVAQLDSKDMDFATWQHLAVRVAHHLAQDDVQGIVITHGTDTLEETAYFLHRVLHASKPVVLTCAMRPASSAFADGPQNLLDAVAVARAEGACGVMAVCAGVVHAAQAVQKVHPYRLDAFDSGEAGPLGFVEEQTPRWLHDFEQKTPKAGVTAPWNAIKNRASDEPWPWIEIVTSHAGARGSAVDALVAAGVKGIVVAATGNGTLHHVLEAALLRAQAAGVQVVRSTRCARGVVLAKPGDALPDTQGLPPPKARVDLLLALLSA